MNKMYRALMKW